MAVWAVIIPADQWATERLFHNESVTLTGAAGQAGAAGREPAAGQAGAAGRAGAVPDEEVLLVADGQVVALARTVKADGDDLVLAYLRRCFDDPVPADGLAPAADGTVTEIDPEHFRRLAAALPGAAAQSGGTTGPVPRPSYLVSVALPIEAASPAAAVRQFWSHVQELGPVELPTYVWPYGDELAMQAFVLGAEANQDPEEEDED